ncbi:unnamed protein product [Lampetra planeri]
MQARLTSQTPTQSSALGIGVGVGVGAGVLLILVITLSVCYCKRRNEDNEDGIYEELEDEGRAQKTEPHYLNYKAQVQHSASPYECPDSQLDSATTKPGVESPYVDLTVQ